MKNLTFIAFVAALVGIGGEAWAQCPGGVCFGARSRASVSFYRARTSAAFAIPTPRPCAPVVATPEPCAPCEAVVEPCAPVETTAEPCAPVESVATCETCASGEFVPTTTAGGAIVKECVGGVCPVRAAARVAVGAVGAVGNALARLNATRARYGLAALRLDANLESGAQYQAGVCATSGTLTHGAGAAEILAQNGQGIETALAQWLNSPAHRSLLLSSRYQFAGVGIVRDRAGRVWCAVRFR